MRHLITVCGAEVRGGCPAEYANERMASRSDHSSPRPASTSERKYRRTFIDVIHAGFMAMAPAERLSITT